MPNARIRLLAIVLLVVSSAIIPGIIPRHETPPTGNDSASQQAATKAHEEAGTLFGNPTVGQGSLVATVDTRNLPPSEESPNHLQLPPSYPLPYRHLVSSSSPTNSLVDPATLGSADSPSVNVFTKFDGINRAQAGTYPPDVQVAAGPNNLMEFTNNVVQVFTKQGVPVKSFTFAQFFNSPNFMGDPKVLFDAASGRWFATAFNCHIGINQIGNYFCQTSAVTVAVSSASDPTGIWKIYSVSGDGDLTDQPIIGVSDDNFVVSSNIYNDLPGTIFFGARVWVINKGELVAGSAKFDFASFGPSVNVESVHPVRSLSSTTTLYMVSTGGADIHNSDFRFFSVTGTPPGAVTIQTSPLTVSPITPSVNAPQPGTSITLDTGQGAAGPGDARIQSAVWFQGKLWFAFNDGCTPAGDSQIRSCFRLTQIDTSSAPMAVKQDFDVGARGLYFFYPALGVDSTGNLAAVYGYSSATNSTCCFPSVAVTGQAVGDPVNTFRQPRTLRAGAGSDTSDVQFDSVSRYGDYFGAGVDPSNETVVWVAGEYITQTNAWATFIAGVAVASPTFSVSTNPTYLGVVVSSSNSSTITLTSLGGFAGTVSLAAAASPTGPTASFNPTSVALTAGGTAISTMTLSLASSTLAGEYAVTVTGTSGSLNVPAIVVVFASGFAISANPASLVLSAGSAATTTIALASINSFGSDIALAVIVSPKVDKTVSVSLNSTKVTLPSGGLTAASLTVSTKSSAPMGLSTITVTGSIRSGQSHSVAIPLAVTPLSIRLTSLNTFTGVTVNTTSTVAVNSPSIALTLSGNASVTATNATTGVILFSQTYPVSRIPIGLVSSSLYQAKFLLDIPISPYPLSSNLNITFSGTVVSSTVQVSRNADIDLDGVVDQSDSSIVNRALGCSLGSACYNPRADLNGDGKVDVLDVSILTNFLGSQELLPSFTISASPGTLAFNVGALANSTVTLADVNGFVGTANLAISISPSALSTSSTGPTATMSKASLAIQAGGTATTTLTVGSTAPGDFSINVTATSGLLSRSTTVMAHVADFGILIVGPQLSAMEGLSNFVLSSTYIAVFSVDGFGGLVSLSTAISPTVTNEPVVSPTPTSLQVSPEGFNTANVRVSTISSPQMNYTITIVATDLSASRSANISLGVTDFYITVSPVSARLPAGGSVSIQVQGTAVNGFSAFGPLSVQGLPSCVTGPQGNSVTLPVNLAGQPSVSTLTLNATRSCSASTSVVTVLAQESFYNQHRNGSAYIVLTISEFQLSTNLNAVGVNQGAFGAVVVAGTSVNNYTSTSVQLSVSGLPSCAASNFNPASPLKMPQGLSNSTTLTLNIGATCASGTFTITVQGNDTRVVRTTTFSLIIGNFAAAGSPNPVYGAIGSTTFTIVGISPFFGIADNLTLSISGMPNCISSSFSPATLALPAGGSSNLTLTVGSSCSTGSSPITLAATGKMVSQTTTLTLVIVSARDLALKLVSVDRAIVYQGVSINPLKITASVQNLGSFTESSITVKFYANATLIGSATIPSLTAGSTANVTIPWGTNVLARGIYVLSASTPTRPGETNLANNRLTGPTVSVRLPGDVNGDGAVTSSDIALIQAAYGSTPANSNWNPAADINNDGAVNQIDLNIATANLGRTS